MRDALAMMLTVTTHGTSLPEEERSCVEHDVILPAEPIREVGDRAAAVPGPLVFDRDELHFVGKLMGTALCDALGLHLWALAVQVWYAHVVVASTRVPADRIVEVADGAIREGTGRRRPIWGEGYDKRFCFDEPTAAQWIAYVERHNVAIGLGPRPWPFVEARQS